MSKQQLVVTPNEAPEKIAGMIRSLIGTMIGEFDRTIEQENEIHRDHLPNSMQGREGWVLEAIYRCRAHGIAPTTENLCHVLELSERLPEPKFIVDSLVSESMDAGAGVRELSAFINMWLQNRRGTVAATKIQEIMANPYADYTDKYNQSLELMALASPIDDVVQYFTEEQLHEAFLREQDDLWLANQSGIDIGPGLPFEAYKAFFSRFKWRELTTFIAKTGWGKTSFIIHVAQYIAWMQKLNCDFVLFLLETDPIITERRRYAQNTLIPMAAMDAGAINLRDPKWAEREAKYLTNIRKKSDTQGHIYTLFLTEPRVEQVLLWMDKCARVSYASGRRICFGIDYLQKFAWWAYPNMKQHEALQMIGERIASRNRTLGSHTFLMAQENEAGEAFGSSVIKKISQLMFSIRREEAEVTKDVPILIGGIPAKDALGGPRFWQRVGDKVTANTTLEGVKANDSPLGTIELLWEGAMNRIIQNPAQIKSLKEQKRLP